MLKLNLESIKNKSEWESKGIKLPDFDYELMRRNTEENPVWVHFGAGNIFRGFIAVLMQELLNQKKADTGIVAVETYDEEIISRIYKPYDSLSMLVILNPDGSLDKKVVGSLSEGLVGDASHKSDWEKLKNIFSKPSLQMASFTITEKGYSLTRMSGELLPDVESDMANGPEAPKHVMAKVASLAYARYLKGQLPIAFASMDNCSHNGEKLHNSVEAIVKKWVENGLVEEGFLSYINDPEKVSFPWSMIDKITPRPSEAVQATLNKLGIESTEIVCTNKKTYISPFVNAEGPQYLVVEDIFPNGRPPLEEAGVLFTDRDTVNMVEKMKVCTCLNPLHTSLAVLGCLLGYDSIAGEMKNENLKKLVEKVGYVEGLPVVVNPGIIDPQQFIKEVIEVRFPNPFMPDTPQRIATDTSQKVGIRFGETIKAYAARPDLDPASLTYIPLVIAGWCRYLMGIDDNGNTMQLSPDPMLDELQVNLKGLELGYTGSVKENLKPILSNKQLFGSDLYEVGLSDKIEAYFIDMISGKGAVSATLEKYLK